ncbi:MAG: Cerebroside-sulfatase [Planctomycetota bacterium]|nr:MAG: Cerebroside-sulfatase [Planctomycetota bacterium]
MRPDKQTGLGRPVHRNPASRRWRGASTARAIFSVFAAAALVPLAVASEATAADKTISRPNIVIVLADDLGYGDVQAYNPQSRIPTPHLNALANSGLTFLDAHTPSAVCTPTRYGLLTGRYCWRTRLKRGVLNGYGEPLIERDRMTIADFLTDAGYVCGVVGKWHLGLGFVRDESGTIDYGRRITDGPAEHGFAYSYIIPASLDFPPYVFIQNNRVTTLPTLRQKAQKFPRFVRQGPRAPDFRFEDCLDRLTDQAVGFIQRQARSGKPFFLYFALTAPHKPVWPHPRFRGRTALGPYADFVVQVDATVGRVLEALQAAGATDQTLVIFTSDNGSYMYRLSAGARDHVDDPTVQGYRPEHHRANGPLRGTKADIWEGGHRVPFIVRWPGHVTAGERTDATICLTDVFATVADILQRPLPDGAAPDGFSFRSVLQGRPSEFHRPPVIHHSVAGMFAIRDGRWKLVLGNGSGGREKPRGQPFTRPYPLFDMQTDLAETRDLSEQHKDIVERLESLCERIRQADGTRTVFPGRNTVRGPSNTPDR